MVWPLQVLEASLRKRCVTQQNLWESANSTRKVASTFKPEGDVSHLLIETVFFLLTSCLQCIIANINADDGKNVRISQKYEIAAFPTIKFFSKDNKEPEDYDGGRTEADIVAYLNEKCGTQRAVGGGLNDEVCLDAFHLRAPELAF
jgi:protein disulfide-isomerase A6